MREWLVVALAGSAWKQRSTLARQGLPVVRKRDRGCRLAEVSRCDKMDSAPHASTALKNVLLCKISRRTMGRQPTLRIFYGVTTTAVLYLTVAALLGAASGIGMVTFGYADGAANLTNRPEACANCHLMNEQLDAWVKSSHGRFATCNDCHAPHDLVGKYYCKARNGFFHSLAFTTGDFPDQIQMHEYNRRVVEDNCRYCLSQLTHQIEPIAAGSDRVESISCLHCHATVGHDT